MDQKIGSAWGLLFCLKLDLERNRCGVGMGRKGLGYLSISGKNQEGICGNISSARPKKRPASAGVRAK